MLLFVACQRRADVGEGEAAVLEKACLARALAKIRRRAGAWGPYQNLAVHYLLAGMRLAARGGGGGS